MIDTAKQDLVLQAASDLFLKNPDWVTFYREVLGLYGVVRQHFATRQELMEFEETPAYAEVHTMLRKLRERAPLPAAEQEPTKVITVRIPKSLHDALKTEAEEHNTSMNKLCISKLLQIIDIELVPPGVH